MASRPAPLAYINGDWRALAEITVSPLDRGFLFADGVYEVIPIYAGLPFRLDAHLDRLRRSMQLIRLTSAPGQVELTQITTELVSRNRLADAAVYLQITRGAYGLRDHGFPALTRPTVFGMCTPLAPTPAELVETGCNAVTRPDLRWHACHIKSIALLANVISRQDALEAGAVEAVLVRDDQITEGSGSNVFAVVDGELVTPPLDELILPGITRQAVLDLARDDGMRVREGPLATLSLRRAQEIWLTSSTREVLPVTRLDGEPVGNGLPGPHWLRIRELYQQLKTRGGLLNQHPATSRP
jgi:D-alanine transaminase